MTDEILPDIDDPQAVHTTSLEQAYARARKNLDEAERILERAVALRADGEGSDERIAQLTRLKEVAQAEVERTRGEL